VWGVNINSFLVLIKGVILANPANNALFIIRNGNFRSSYRV